MLRGALLILCSMALLSTFPVPVCGASEFLISVRNRCSTPLSYMLFQKAENPSINSYSHAWKVGNLGSPGYEGPHVLPEDIQISVIDTDQTDGSRSNVARVTGPTSAEFGDIFLYSLLSKSGSPSLKNTGKKTTDGTIQVQVNPNSIRPVNAVIFKNGVPLVSESNVRPRAEAIIKIQPIIYINYIEPGSYTEGDGFRAVTIGQSAIGFPLDPGSPTLYIDATCESNGSIDFTSNVDGFQP